MYNQRYNQFYSTGQVFGLSSSKGQIFLRNLISLSQTFHRRDIHPSESVLQMCNNGSYGLKTIIWCSLQNLKVAVADMQLWVLKGKIYVYSETYC